MVKSDIGIAGYEMDTREEIAPPAFRPAAPMQLAGVLTQNGMAERLCRSAISLQFHSPIVARRVDFTNEVSDPLNLLPAMFSEFVRNIDSCFALGKLIFSEVPKMKHTPQGPESQINQGKQEKHH